MAKESGLRDSANTWLAASAVFFVLGAALTALTAHGASSSSASPMYLALFALGWLLIIGCVGTLFWGLVLHVADRQVQNRYRTVSLEDPADLLVRTFNVALTEGRRLQRSYEDNPTQNQAAVEKWEQHTESRIIDSGGEYLVGLFATPEMVPDLQLHPIPWNKLGRYPNEVVATWIRLDRKLTWLRGQIKSGPHA